MLNVDGALTEYQSFLAKESVFFLRPFLPFDNLLFLPTAMIATRIGGAPQERSSESWRWEDSSSSGLIARTLVCACDMPALENLCGARLLAVLRRLYFPTSLTCTDHWILPPPPRSTKPTANWKLPFRQGLVKCTIDGLHFRSTQGKLGSFHAVRTGIFEQVLSCSHF
jgi:hypothetical protein